MSTSKKLFLGFFVVICLVIVIGVIGIAGMQRLQLTGASMYENQVHSLEYVGRAATKFREIRRMFNQVVTSSWYDDKKGALDAKKKHEAYIDEFIYLLDESYKAASTSETDEFNKLYTRIIELFIEETIPLFNDAIDACIYDIPDHYNNLYIRVKMSHINKVTDQIEELILGMMDLNSAVAKKTSLTNTATTQLLIILQAVLIVFAVITAVIVAFFVTRSIAVPINESAEVLREISKGNFDVRVKGNYKGELSIIKDSVNDTAIKLALYLKDKIDAERASHEADIAKERSDAAREAIMSGINYASKIQMNLLPVNSVMDSAFSDYSVIWKPRDVVGGDIYWIKRFDKGVALCVADCTGHGTPGALLTMLVVSALEAAVGQENCHDTADIIWRLEQRLADVFSLKANAREISSNEIRDGCDLAVLFIAKDGSVTRSAGHTNVFVCNGKEVRRIKGQKIYVGEGHLNNKDEIETVHIPADPNNKFYIGSDGLFDQPGGARSAPFGYRRFEEIILKSHSDRQSVISDAIWEAFEVYRGKEPRVDDFELITFKP